MSKTSLISSEDGASPLSRAFLSYLNPLFSLGNSKPDGLAHDDLGIVSKQDKARVLYERFEEEWAKEKKLIPAKRSLWGVLWRTVGYWRLANAVFLYAIFTGMFVLYLVYYRVEICCVVI